MSIKEGKMKARIIKPYFDNELKRMTNVGEIIEVTEERFLILNGNNFYKEKYAEAIEVIETAKKEIRSEKAVKKTTKKK